MLIQKLIREYVLIEGRLDVIKSKFPDINVEEISKNDPSGSNKYLEWMTKQISSGFKADDIYPTVDYFHNNITKFDLRDINSYKTLTELEGAVKTASEKVTSSQRRKKEKSGGEVVYENNEARMIFVGDKNSSCAYGMNTKWCIAMKDEHHYEEYSGNNVVFYFVMRKNPQNDQFDKVAISLQRDFDNKIIKIEIFDSSDIKRSPEQVISEIDEFDIFLDKALKDAVKRPKGLIARVHSGEATPQEELQLISMYDNDENREKILTKIKFKSSEALSQLAKDKSKNVRINIAFNDDTPPEVLSQLAKDEDEDVRMYVAKNINAPPEILYQLAEDENVYIKIQVARNTNTPPEALEQLVEDENEYIRINVARNINTQPETLSQLAKNKSEDIRVYVAENPNTPQEVLSQLARDKSINVKMSVAVNSNTPQEVLIQFSKDESKHVRTLVAGNPSTPPKVLTQLAKDKIINVRINVVENPNTPQEVLTQLARDKDEYVRTLVAKNSNFKKI